MHDPRLGRFLSVDPLAPEYPWNSPYAFAENRVISALELEGLEAWDLNGGGTVHGPYSNQEAAQAAAASGEVEITYKEAKDEGPTDFNLMERTEKRRMTTPWRFHVEGRLGRTGYISVGSWSLDDGSSSESQLNEVGEAEGLEGATPLWGSGRNAINDFQRGRYITGTFNSVMALSDLLLVKAAFTGATKATLSFTGKLSYAAKRVPDGKFYSVAFETKIPSNLYPGRGAHSHFKAANTALAETMASDVAFANSMKQLGIGVPRSSAGSITGGKIPNWVWHHSTETGVMQLVPQIQHTTGSMFWKTLHPGGKGGMAIWGGGY